VTSSTNRNLPQPTKIHKQRRKAKFRETQDAASKGKGKDDADSEDARPLLKKLTEALSGSSSRTNERVDVVVRDEEAEQTERVRARKDGSARWNEAEAPDQVNPLQHQDAEHGRNLDEPLRESEGEHEQNSDGEEQSTNPASQYRSFREERDAWGSGEQ
jgi:hypothetical protein